MSSKNLLLTLLAVPLGLAGCNGNSSITPGGDNSSYSNGTSAVVHWTYDLEDEPLPECIPMHAPTDYESVHPADANPYDAFFFMAHKKANSNVLLMAQGSANATVSGLGSYVQKIASLTMNDETTVLNYFASTGEITIGSAEGTGFQTVNRAARAFEDIDRNIYVGQETSDGAEIVIEDDVPEDEFAGYVTNWGSVQEGDRKYLLENFGHDLFTTTAYYVPDASAITSASMRPDGDNYVFTFNFSLVDDDTYTNAARYYSSTLNEGVAQGLLTFTITELTYEVTVNSDWEMIRSNAIEKYDIDVPVFGLTTECINNTTTVAWYYDDIDDCEIQDAVDIWNESVTGVEYQQLIDFIGE